LRTGIGLFGGALLTLLHLKCRLAVVLRCLKTLFRPPPSKTLSRALAFDLVSSLQLLGAEVVSGLKYHSIILQELFHFFLEH
jgi:hypothetical protein